MKIRNTYNYNTISVSLDVLCFDHDELVHLRKTNPENKLFQMRGQSGTHDVELAVAFFKSLNDLSVETTIPSFDKRR